MNTNSKLTPLQSGNLAVSRTLWIILFASVFPLITFYFFITPDTAKSYSMEGNLVLLFGTGISCAILVKVLFVFGKRLPKDHSLCSPRAYKQTMLILVCAITALVVWGIGFGLTLIQIGQIVF